MDAFALSLTMADRGKVLADRLNHLIGSSLAINDLCRRICFYASRYGKTERELLNEALSTIQIGNLLTKSEKQQRCIIDLAWELAEVAGCRFRADFESPNRFNSFRSVCLWIMTDTEVLQFRIEGS